MTRNASNARRKRMCRFVHCYFRTFAGYHFFLLCFKMILFRGCDTDIPTRLRILSCVYEKAIEGELIVEITSSTKLVHQRTYWSQRHASFQQVCSKTCFPCMPWSATMTHFSFMMAACVAYIYKRKLRITEGGVLKILLIVLWSSRRNTSICSGTRTDSSTQQVASEGTRAMATFIQYRYIQTFFYFSTVLGLSIPL